MSNPFGEEPEQRSLGDQSPNPFGEPGRSEEPLPKHATPSLPATSGQRSNVKQTQGQEPNPFGEPAADSEMPSGQPPPSSQPVDTTTAEGLKTDASPYEEPKPLTRETFGTQEKGGGFKIASSFQPGQEGKKRSESMRSSSDSKKKSSTPDSGSQNRKGSKSEKAAEKRKLKNQKEKFPLGEGLPPPLSEKSVVGGTSVSPKSHAIQRGFTDLPCCIVLLLFILIWLGIGIYALRNKTYLFHIIQDCPAEGACSAKTVCVGKCPSKYFDCLAFGMQSGDGIIAFDDVATAGQYCASDTLPKTAAEYQDHARNDSKGCPIYFTPSRPLLNHCVPLYLIKDSAKADVAEKKKLMKELPGEKDMENVGRYMAGVGQSTPLGAKLSCDFYYTWWTFLLFFLVISLISFGFVSLVQCCPSLLVWLAVIGFGILLLSSVILLWAGFSEAGHGTAHSLDDIVPLRTGRKEAWLCYAVVCTIVFPMYVLSHIRVCAGFKTTNALIGETSGILRKAKRLLILPAATYVLQLVVLIIGAVFFVHILGLKQVKCVGEDKSTCEYTVVDKDYMWPLLLLCVVITVWVWRFLGALSNMVPAMAVCDLLGIGGDGERSDFELVDSFKVVYYFHCGSAAAASAVHTLSLPVRAVLSGVRTLVSIPSIKGLLEDKCNCCLSLSLDRMSDSPLILVAARGTNFYNSGLTMVEITQNEKVAQSELTTAHKLSSAILFIAKLTVVLLFTMTAFSLFVGKWTPKFSENIYQKQINTLIVALIAWFVADLFFAVYDVGIKSILIFAGWCSLCLPFFSIIG